jgi:hypothetical protein
VDGGAKPSQQPGFAVGRPPALLGQLAVIGGVDRGPPRSWRRFISTMKVSCRPIWLARAAARSLNAPFSARNPSVGRFLFQALALLLEPRNLGGLNRSARLQNLNLRLRRGHVDVSELLGV